jgi:hypothetical protein
MEPVGRIQELEDRLARLEKKVFGSKRQQAQDPANESTTDQISKGPTGGIRILISERFFESKRTLGDVRGALEQRGYQYSPQAVDIALKRLSKRDEVLVSFKVGKRKIYAERR